MPQDPNDFSLEARKKELTEHFEKAGSEKARHEIELLPYYHQLENEITRAALLSDSEITADDLSDEIRNNRRRRSGGGGDGP